LFVHKDRQDACPTKSHEFLDYRIIMIHSYKILAEIHQALQAISQEIDLEKLLPKLIKVVLENANAQKAALILENAGQFRLESVGVVNLTTLEVSQTSEVLEISEILLPLAVVQYVINNQKSLVLADASQDGSFKFDPYIQRQQPKSILAVPLLYLGRLLGVLYLENNLKPDAFSLERLQILEILSAQIAISVVHAQLYENIESANEDLKQTTAKLEDYNRMLEVRVIERTQRLEMVATLSEHLNTILDMQELLNELVNQVKEKFNYYHVHVYLVDEPRQNLVMASGAGEAGKIMKRQGHAISLDSRISLVARAVRSREIVQVDDVRQAADWLPNPLLPETRCEMAIPVIAEGRVLGVLDVQAAKVAGLDDADANLLRSLANHIAVALNNAWLFEQTQQALAEAEELYLISQEMVKSADMSALVEVTVAGLSIPSINRAVLIVFDYDGYGKLDWLMVRGNWYSGEGQEPTDVGECYLQDSEGRIFFPDTLLTPDSKFFTDIQDNEQREPKLMVMAKRLNIRTLAALPLWSQTSQIGVLLLEGEEPHRFEEREIRLCLALLGQFSVAVENRLLLEQTQQRAAQLAEAKEELTKLNADKDKFFSIVAHDLKGPFQPLLGMAELLPMLADTLSPQDIRDMGGTIYRAAKNVFSLLENLLQWSRMQMGRLEYEPSQIEMEQIVEQTVSLLTHNAQDKGIMLRGDVPENILVYADKNMLDTVIRNLTTNALKFTPRAGGVTIAAREQLLTAEGQAINDSLVAEFVEVSVADTGVGISPEDLAKLFKIEVHHTTLGTAKEQGTGLGLLICKEMVEKNGGRIWVESEVGKGTVFKFTVPIG